MKSLEVKDTYDNLIQTFCNDSIGRNIDVYHFISMLESIEGQMTISLDGKWGSGKTFFVKQSKMILDAYNPISEFSKTKDAEKIKAAWERLTRNGQESVVGSYATAYYDAWSHDNESDPILSIVYEIMKESSHVAKPGKTREWSQLLGTIGDCLLDRNISGLLTEFKGTDIFQKQKDNDSLDTTISKFFASLMPEYGNKLIVFIDELDRCSPQYAIKLLERVKHYFTQENVIFVFSMNPEELQHTIKKNYGDEFSASKYLDRFFDIRIGLQSLDLEKYMFYLGLSSVHSNIRETVCKEIIRKMNLEMREISRFLPITKMATFKAIDSENAGRNDWMTHDKGYSRIFCLGVIVPIAIGLKIHNGDEYLDFVEGRNSKWLKKVLDTEELHSWICDSLLSEDETVKEFADKKLVTYDEKIQDAYDAVFNKSYDGINEYQTRIGVICFSKDSKQQIMSAISMMSNYSQFE